VVMEWECKATMKGNQKYLILHAKADRTFYFYFQHAGLITFFVLDKLHPYFIM